MFEPLGMKETGFSTPARQTDRLPSQYTTDFQTGTVGLQTLTGPTCGPGHRCSHRERVACSQRSTTTWRSRGC